MAMTAAALVLDPARALKGEIRANAIPGHPYDFVLSLRETEVSASGVDVHMSEAQLEALDILIRAALLEIADLRKQFGEQWLGGSSVLAQTA